MLICKFRDLTKPILMEMIDAGFMREHLNMVQTTQRCFTDDEVELLLGTVMNGDEEATVKVLSEIRDFEDWEIEDAMEQIFTIYESELVIHYYTKRLISESEMSLLSAYEELMLSNPETKRELEDMQRISIEWLVGKIEHCVNEYTIRKFKKDIFDVLDKKLQYEEFCAEKKNATTRKRFIDCWDVDRYTC